MKNGRNILIAVIIVILFIIVSLLEKREHFEETTSASPDSDGALTKIHEFMEKLIGMKTNVNSKETNNEIELRIGQLQQYLKLLRQVESNSSDEKIMNEKNKEFIVLKCSPNTTEFTPVSSSKLITDEDVTRKILDKIHGELEAIEKIHSFDKTSADTGSST